MKTRPSDNTGNEFQKLLRALEKQAASEERLKRRADRRHGAGEGEKKTAPRPRK